jgi:hypothetical protein
MFPVTGKFKGLKLDDFTRFYLKLAGKTAVFTPKLQGFIYPSNLALKTAIFP